MRRVGIVERSGEHHAALCARLDLQRGEIAPQDVIAGIATVVATIDVHVVGPGLPELVPAVPSCGSPLPYRQRSERYQRGRGLFRSGISGR